MALNPLHNRFAPLFEQYCYQNEIDGKEIPISIGDKKVTVKVASTQQSQMKGFQQEPAPNDKGILFVFDDERPLSFWMKNVSFPLDIVFFDTSGNMIGDPITMEPESETNYASDKPARYALELKSGWFKQNGISNTDKLKI